MALTGATPRRMTLTDNIIARAAGLDAVQPGDEVWVRVDLAVMNDSSGPRRIAPVIERFGGRLWDPERVVLVSDHFIPASTQRHAEILAVTRQWAAEKGLTHFYEYDGIMHNLLLEKRLARPGTLLVGADSHTVTAGAAGMVAIPIGSNELATVLVTGEVWLRVPESVGIRLEGRLPRGVMARDVNFLILGALNSDFAMYRAVELSGPALADLSLQERSVLSNGGIEMGAKNAIVPADATTWADFDLPPDPWLEHDPAAAFERLYTFDVSALEPQVARPHHVDNISGVSAVAGEPVTVAHIGSCVGAKLSDLRAAARVLRGRRARVPLLVTPATRAGYEAALADGTLATLLAAGATVQAPGCGPCAAVHMGILGPGERAIATVTRNFRGRMGSPESEIFLGSPLTVAASAVEGRLADPRPYLDDGHMERTD
jgi:3-isopropylmalate/(R)-2-methylmalate dehydratase large subunit